MHHPHRVHRFGEQERVDAKVRQQGVHEGGHPLLRGEENEHELGAEGRERLAVGRVGLVGGEERERFLERLEAGGGASCEDGGIE